MNKPTFSERFRYWFDNWMSRGTLALMALLGIATVVLVLVVGVIVAIFRQTPDDDPERSFGDILWGNLMRTLDPGTMGGDSGWGFRIFMLIITIGGLIIVASLIGIISGAFDSKVEELRKGRSKVLEKDHTLILGWNSKVFPIVSEICIANESRRKAVIVVLADKDKVEMEDELRAMVGKTGKTKIICRTGDPMNLTDLEIANPANARSIILLAGDDSPDPDADVIKTALALTNNPRRKAEKYHIVGELEDAASLEAATLVGRDEAHWVLGDDLIGRITVQSCRQSGLSVVYSELLDFDGDEIYFTEQPSLYGKTYFDTQLAFADSTVMGLVKAGTVILNPAADTLYESGDQLIVIAEDDSAIRLATPGVPDAAAVSTTKALKPKPERTLVLGYNSGLTRMLEELNEYVASGSKVTVLADVETPDFPKFDNLTIEFRRGDSTNRAILDSLKVESFNHIIVLAYKGLDIQRADGKTLITLLQLRDIEDRAGVDLNIVSEMLDDRNRELAEVTNADDFIVSDKLISLMLSQVSENKKLTQVFDDLFSSVGSEVYLQPVEQYVAPGTAVNFYTVLEAARRRGETALGYRVAADAHKSDKGYGVTVNPVKTESVTFSAGDKIIVLAEG
ncbi:MAG: potassium transporter TrkA [Actinobacteria bacterium]|nr:potassium transporter TrkA [Actinomycetota bacterium]